MRKAYKRKYAFLFEVRFIYFRLSVCMSFTRNGMNLMCHGIIILIKHDFMLGGECVNRREKYKAKLGELFDIPVNAFSGMTTVEIRGFYEVMIQGCTGISDYSPSLCVLSTYQDNIVVCGKDLKLTVFGEDRIVIHGTVESVSRKEGSGGDIPDSRKDKR